MNKIVDGSAPLAQQENAIRNHEANGFEMLTLSPDVTNPPTNTAAFQQLPIGALPKRLHLMDGTALVPPGVKVFWMGTIYIQAQLKSACAYRA